MAIKGRYAKLGGKAKHQQPVLNDKTHLKFKVSFACFPSFCFFFVSLTRETDENVFVYSLAEERRLGRPCPVRRVRRPVKVQGVIEADSRRRTSTSNSVLNEERFASINETGHQLFWACSQCTCAHKCRVCWHARKPGPSPDATLVHNHSPDATLVHQLAGQSQPFSPRVRPATSLRKSQHNVLTDSGCSRRQTQVTINAKTHAQ